jgi:hypothetical protein
MILSRQARDKHSESTQQREIRFPSGYRHVNADGTKASSWGGSVLWSEEDEKWHMFASELVNSCGLHAWACNSQVPTPAHTY